MTFLAFETSAEGGRPVELFEFRSSTADFNFTSAEDDITFESILYSAETISRTAIVTQTNDTDDRIQVTVPIGNTFVEAFKAIPPGQKSTLTVRKFHRDDTDLEARQLFKGVVQSVGFQQDANLARINIVPLFKAKSRQIPRITFQGLCNAFLYDANCKIIETDPDFQKFLNISVVSGNTITADGAGAFGSTFFQAGFAKFAGDHRHVTFQSGDVLTLIQPFITTPLNQTIQINAGCRNRLVPDCQVKFDNVINYVGFPDVPLKNPFEGLK